MIAKDSDGNVRLVSGMENLPVVANLLTVKDKRFIKAALYVCYYSYSPEGISQHRDLPRTKKAVRISHQYLKEYDVEKLFASDIYIEFESTYIETMYTPEWAVYMSWQKDADAYIKILTDNKFDQDKPNEKLDYLKKAKDLLSLGTELKKIAIGTDRFKSEDDNIYKPRLFEKIQ